MSESSKTLKNDFEELVNKTIEANKVFMNESGNLFQKLIQHKGESKTLNLFQNDFFSKAF